MELGAGLILGLIAVMLGAALLNGVAGFGFALVAVAGMAVLLEPRFAIVLMSLVTPVLTAMQLRHHWAHRGVLGRLPMLLAGAGVGSIIGSQLLVVLPGFVLSIALGLFALWFSVTSLRGTAMQIDARIERRIAPGVGLVAGMSQGTLGASGPVLGSYILAIGLRGRDFIFAISAVFALMSVTRVVTLAALQQYTVPAVALGIGLVVPAFLGQRIGFALQGRLSATAFRRVVVGVLLLASANLLWRGMSDAVTALV